MDRWAHQMVTLISGLEDLPGLVYNKDNSMINAGEEMIYQSSLVSSVIANFHYYDIRTRMIAISNPYEIL